MISNTIAAKDTILKCIAEHGWNPENNYYYYQNKEVRGMKNVFLKFNDMGILTQVHNDKTWHLFANGILAPSEKRIGILTEFISHALKKYKRVKLELTDELRKELIRKLKNSPYKVMAANYILYWPVFNMKKWDDKLEGGDWKKLRNLRNKLHKEHRVEVKPSTEFSKEELKNIVEEWRKSRPSKERSEFEQYLKWIDSGFMGCDCARSVVIDGEPCTITAGWKIPNSNNYYSAIGLCNYKYEGLNEVANADDLIFLKSQGYDYVDFGGGEKPLTAFKMKFKPESVYETAVFSIVNKA